MLGASMFAPKMMARLGFMGVHEDLMVVGVISGLVCLIWLVSCPLRRGEEPGRPGLSVAGPKCDGAAWICAVGRASSKCLHGGPA